MKIKIAISLTLLLMLVSCDIKKSNTGPGTNFIRVYSDPVQNNAYFPADFIETEDKGFIIVSGRYGEEELNYPGTFLVKTDDQGMIKWTYTADGSVLSPVPDILNINGNYHIFCMQDNLRARLMRIEDNGSSGALAPVFEADAFNPLRAYHDNNGDVVLLSFDIIGNKTVISKYDQLMSRQWNRVINAYLGSDYFVRYHLNKEDHEIPFFMGGITLNGLESHYYINCFTNTGLSTAFINAASGDFTGSIMGNTDEFNIDAAYTSMMHLQDEVFTISRFHTRDNYIHSRQTLSILEHQHSTELTENPLNVPELDEEAAVISLKDMFNGKEHVVLASTSKTNQVILYFFNTSENKLAKTKYLGHTNPIKVKAMKRGSDDSLVLLCQTWEAGRYQRIMLYKISMEELGF
ncbi:MAG: hypothetical protein HC906_07585 [Bacteroidales bacterium]|nr:hypothetical protein [Bacteroidales bacterium]